MKSQGQSWPLTYFSPLCLLVAWSLLWCRSAINLFQEAPMCMRGSEHSVSIFIFMIPTIGTYEWEILVPSFSCFFRRGICFYLLNLSWKMLKMMFLKFWAIPYLLFSGVRMTFLMGEMNETLISIWPCIHETKRQQRDSFLWPSPFWWCLRC